MEPATRLSEKVSNETTVYNMSLDKEGAHGAHWQLFPIKGKFEKATLLSVSSAGGGPSVYHKCIF